MKRLAVVLALAAGAAQAQRLQEGPSGEVRFGADPYRAGVLTSGEVLLRSHATVGLTFWISLGAMANDEAPEGPAEVGAEDGAEDGATLLWRPYTITPGDAALIRAPAAAFAIATSRYTGDPEADAPPPLAPGEAEGPTGVFDYGRFEGGERVEFCWSAAERRWAVQRIGGGRC